MYKTVDLDHHYYLLRLCEQCLGVKKNIFFRNTLILQFLPQNYFPIMVGVHKIHISLSLYPINSTNQI